LITQRMPGYRLVGIDNPTTTAECANAIAISCLKSNSTNDEMFLKEHRNVFKWISNRKVKEKLADKLEIIRLKKLSKGDFPTLADEIIRFFNTNNLGAEEAHIFDNQLFTFPGFANLLPLETSPV